jgi:hypothetical protein
MMRKALIVFVTLAAFTVPAVSFAPRAEAITCPSGSVAWNSAKDDNGNNVFQNAENFGTGADTCFTPAAHAGMTLAQATPVHSANPSSYPNDDYGCGSSACTYGWTSELWSNAAPTVTGSADTTGMQNGTLAGLLTDSVFTAVGGTHQGFTAEVEVVSWTSVPYPRLGFCASESCGAVPVTIGAVTWWRSERDNTGWPRWIYVGDTMSQSVDLNLAEFYNEANDTGYMGGLGNLLLNRVAFGFELWQGGTGLHISSESLTSLP